MGMERFGVTLTKANCLLGQFIFFFTTSCIDKETIGKNLFKTVEISSVDILALCPRAVFSTIQEREKNMYI